MSPSSFWAASMARIWPICPPPMRAIFFLIARDSLKYGDYPAQLLTQSSHVAASLGLCSQSMM